MSTDPRLQNTALLTLAAWRIQQRHQAARTAPPDWRYSEGLAALLEAARHLPRREPWALPSMEDDSGLAGLLREARARQQDRESRGGAC